MMTGPWAELCLSPKRTIMINYFDAGCGFWLQGREYFIADKKIRVRPVLIPYISIKAL